mmetsp:Transcript_31359/g.56841  ORF Transcript_31359/g.56841 Transcript_31359/m.56841 type:complete len:201 (+) Transcript_31359:166-768(+)
MLRYLDIRSTLHNWLDIGLVDILDSTQLGFQHMDTPIRHLVQFTKFRVDTFIQPNHLQCTIYSFINIKSNFLFWENPSLWILFDKSIISKNFRCPKIIMSIPTIDTLIVRQVNFFSLSYQTRSIHVMFTLVVHFGRRIEPFAIAMIVHVVHWSQGIIIAPCNELHGRLDFVWIITTMTFFFIKGKPLCGSFGWKLILTNQ